MEFSHWYKRLFKRELLSKILDKCFVKNIIINPRALSENPNLTMEIIQKYFVNFGVFDWDWSFISANPNITMEIIEKYPEEPWDFFTITNNPNITMEMIKKFSLKRRMTPCFSNSNITFQHVQEYLKHHEPSLETKISLWTGFSRNVNTTIEMIETLPDNPWDWQYLSANPNLTIEMLRKNRNRPWDYWYVSCNPILTMEIIEEFSADWNWYFISSNPSITMEDVEKYPKNLFSDNIQTSFFPHGNIGIWRGLSKNPNITLKMIEQYFMDKDWNVLEISENPNITVEFIEKYFDRNWDWRGVSKTLTFPVSFPF